MFFKTKIYWYKLFESLKQAEQLIPINTAVTKNIAGKKIYVAHTPEGFFAGNDKCPHNGASLSLGFCSEDNSIVCPMHRYRFDLTTGRAKSGIGDVVRTYPIEVRPDGIYIGLEKLKWNWF